jgi:hypothetical protein
VLTQDASNAVVSMLVMAAVRQHVLVSRLLTVTKQSPNLPMQLDTQHSSKPLHPP